MTDYKPGDVVTLTHPDGRTLGNYEVQDFGMEPCIWVLNGYFPIEGLTSDGLKWVVTEHRPAVQLPTEPRTVWLDCGGFPWVVDDNGLMVALGTPRWNPEEHAPFTRLAPVSETAAEVIEYVRKRDGKVRIGTNDWVRGYEAALDAIGQKLTQAAEHFGVDRVDQKETDQ